MLKLSKKKAAKAVELLDRVEKITYGWSQTLAALDHTVFSPEYGAYRAACKELQKILTDPTTDTQQKRIDKYGERLQALVDAQAEKKIDGILTRVARDQNELERMQRMRY